MTTISGPRRQSLLNTSEQNNTINSVTTPSLKNKWTIDKNANTKKCFILTGLN